MASYMAKRRSVRRAKLIALHHGRCIKCGSGENLEFDHRDRTERLFSLSGAGLDKAWTKILAEAEKCDLLCHEHHREKTRQCNETGGGHNKLVNYHGTETGYTNHACRCDACRQAWYDVKVQRGTIPGTRGRYKIG